MHDVYSAGIVVSDAYVESQEPSYPVPMPHLRDGSKLGAGGAGDLPPTGGVFRVTEHAEEQEWMGRVQWRDERWWSASVGVCGLCEQACGLCGLREQAGV